MTARTLTVDARRIVRWATGFGERHGVPQVSVADGVVVLAAPDGATARLSTAFGEPVAAGRGPDSAADPLGTLAALALAPRRVAVVLARRGGYACAVVTADAVLASKVGTRYVQGRTAAGGWSQQRFARRRENQTDDLVRAAADVAARVLDPGTGFDAVLTGGDRTLADRVLADPRLARLAGLPRGPHLAVGDPRSDVVKALPEHVRSVTVALEEP